MGRSSTIPADTPVGSGLTSPRMAAPTASVIAATLNEEANIDHVLDTALRSRAVVEVIIADGGSHDATVEKVLERAKNDPRRISRST